jgi:hypothetical protein
MRISAEDRLRIKIGVVYCSLSYVSSSILCEISVGDLIN